jgi:non-specific serine/threonine protein kinase
MTEPEGRLVTLVGPGGVGKTRLALELAPRLALVSTEIAFVELELLANPDLLLPTVAHALSVREQPREALIDTLIAAIVDRPGVLLLLDTCEHLVEACAQMSNCCCDRALTCMCWSRVASGSTFRVRPSIK